MPPVPVTATEVRPAVPAGVTHVRLMLFITVTLVAGFPPKVTLVTPLKLDPPTVTDVPPAVDPLFGEQLDTVGGAMYVNARPLLPVP